MDEQERGRLLVEKEKAENTLTDLRRQFTQMGEYLVRFGENVRKNPEKIVFSNAPGEQASYPRIPPVNAPRFVWKEIPDKETIAHLIQELRNTVEQIQNITLRLRP